MSKIYGSATGGFGMPKTFVLTDKNGNEFTGVVTNSVQVFDATKADVKVGKIFASSDGIQTGEDTKTYRVTMCTRLIYPNENCSIPLSNYDRYDYTGFQGLIVLYSSDYSTNAETIGVTIGDSVFSAKTSEKISDITKNSNTKSIDLNITNNSENIYSIRYFTYREEV